MDGNSTHLIMIQSRLMMFHAHCDESQLNWSAGHHPSESDIIVDTSEEM